MGVENYTAKKYASQVIDWLMRCNRAINPLSAIKSADSIGAGMRKFYGEDKAHWYTFTTERKELDAAGKETGKMLQTHWNTARIGGSALGAYALTNTVFRFGSGGGLYKDSEGNTDIIGLPFI